MIIIKNENRYFLGTQQLPARLDTDEKVMNFFKNSGFAHDIQSGDVPEGAVLIKQQPEQVINLTRKSDGLYLGSIKIGTDLEKVRKLWTSPNVKLLVNSDLIPGNKRFFKALKDKDGWLACYDSDGYHVYPGDGTPVRSLPELEEQLKTTYGPAIQVEMMRFTDPLAEFEQKKAERNED
jgi:hypothetical protein